MSDEPRDRSEDEEEFEPLDRFFAPIEDVEWTEEEDAEGGPTRPSPSSSGGSLDEDDLLLGSDISSDPLGELDLGDEPTAEPPSPGTGQETFSLESGALARHEPAPQRELTLEDLKSAPPEYSELPGPPDEDDTLEPTPAGAVVFEDAEDVADEEVETDEVLEPDLQQVEAAADRFAEALRGDPPDPEPAARPVADTGFLPPPDEVEQELLADLDAEPTPPPTVTVGVTDSLGGPSWQEPTSREVSATPAAAPIGGRNLPMAFITGIVLVAIGVVSIVIGKAPFAVVAGAVIVLAQGELYAALHRKGYQPATAVGLVFAGMISAAAYLRGESGAVAMLALGVVATFLWFMATPAKARQNLVMNIALTILPLAYVGFLASFVLVILGSFGGRALILAVIGLTVGYDIAAYGAGSLFGNRPLAPSISPRKSVEGAAIATLVIIVASVAIIPGLNVWHALTGTKSGWVQAIGLGLIVAIFAPLGDLAESLLKRDLGIKDMGSILPGHGGLLDRVDSILLAAPAAWYFFRLFLGG